MTAAVRISPIGFRMIATYDPLSAILAASSSNTEFVASAVLTTLLAFAAYVLIAIAERLLTPWAGRRVAT